MNNNYKAFISHSSAQKEVCYNVYWGMEDNVSIFNDEGDVIHLIRIAEEKVSQIEG